MSHMVNKHSDLEDPVFNKCAHGEIGPKKWLIPGIIKIYHNIQILFILGDAWLHTQKIAALIVKLF